jgi:hypothetical protein
VLYQLSYLGLETICFRSGRILHAERKIVKQTPKFFYKEFTSSSSPGYPGRLRSSQSGHNQGVETMFKITALFKKITLAALVLALGLAALPLSGALAAGKEGRAALQATSPRLERLWARQQRLYTAEGNRLADARSFIARVQALIDKATRKGWDTSSVQAALNALSSVIPAVQAAHAPGAAIVSAHTGFDAAGQVTDRASALATTRSLAQVLQNTRLAMHGAGQALRSAVQALRAAHPRPIPTPTP